MKTANDIDEHGDMPAEIDFSGGIRGKYKGVIEPLNNLILIEPDLFETFPSAEAVNDALRVLKRAATKAARPGKRRVEARAS